MKNRNEETYPFLETIKVRDGRFYHPEDHQIRMKDTLLLYYGEKVSVPDLKSHLILPEGMNAGWYKCRVLYGKNIGNVEFQSYVVRNIRRIALVEAPEINYSLKWADRSIFTAIQESVTADDFIITQKGRITDSSYANVLFHRAGRWVTSDTPLLRGTQLQRLLHEKKVTEESITVADLHRFDRFKYINALLDMADGPEWPIEVLEGWK